MKVVVTGVVSIAHIPSICSVTAENEASIEILGATPAAPPIVCKSLAATRGEGPAGRSGDLGPQDVDLSVDYALDGAGLGLQGWFGGMANQVFLGN